MAWRKSSYSGDHNECVEMARSSGWAAVRDSKLGEASPVLSFSVKAFGVLLARCKAGGAYTGAYTT